MLRYRLKKRLQRQEETRRRIVRATVELHGSLGPARTTISAIARRAGVQRLTVYRHFPDERSLFFACGKQFFAEHPFPDTEPWERIADPVARFEVALREVFHYYRSVEVPMAKVLADAALKPALLDASTLYFQHWATMRDVLARGWSTRGQRQKLLAAAIAHALDFRTWHALVYEQGLDDEQVLRLMVGMARSL